MSPDAEETELQPGAWVPCEFCQDFWCLVHEQHVHDCSCPSIEVWMAAGVSPYGELAEAK